MERGRIKKPLKSAKSVKTHFDMFRQASCKANKSKSSKGVTNNFDTFLSASDFQSEVGEVFGEIGGELPAKFGRRFWSLFCWGNRQKHFPPKLHRKFHHQTSLRGSGLWRALLFNPVNNRVAPVFQPPLAGSAPTCLLRHTHTDRHARTHAHTHTRTHAHTHTRRHAHEHVHARARARAHAHVHAQIRRAWIWCFWGPEVPKHLFLKGFGTSGWKIMGPDQVSTL